MRNGQRIEVQEAFGNKDVKRLVSADERNVYVCREEEFRKAGVENREPITIGFPRSSVLKVMDEGTKG